MDQKKSGAQLNTDKLHMLALTFSYPLSLEDWVRMGLFDREKALYEAHLAKDHFDKILWITYGEKDEELRDTLVQEGKLDARILVRSAYGVPFSQFSSKEHGRAVCNLLGEIGKEISIVKTDQMDGAWVAEAIAKTYGIPFYFRTGFTQSTFKYHEVLEAPSCFKRAKKYFWFKKIQGLEKRLYGSCTKAVVSSEHDRLYLLKNKLCAEEKLSVQTNYIDCHLFYPGETPFEQRKDRVLFVGRLNPQKNLENVLTAIGKLGIGIDLYGRDELEGKLQLLCREQGIDANFHEPVPNHVLPEIYGSYRYFILGSIYEGMPKTLLEAMACGCVCFGTKVEGTGDVLVDGKNGVLIDGTDSESIYRKMKNYLGGDGYEDTLSERNEVLSKGAVTYIQNTHSLEHILAEEWENMQLISPHV